MIWIPVAAMIISVVFNIRDNIRTRKLYAQLKEERKIAAERMAGFALDMWLQCNDPAVTKEEISDFMESLYHELKGESILKTIKK